MKRSKIIRGVIPNLSCTIFLEKYGSLDLYDEDLKKIFIIDHKQLQSDKNSGWTLIGIPDKPDGTLSDHEYLGIHYDLFDIIKSSHQDRNIMWKFILNEPNVKKSQSESTKIYDDKIQNKKRSITKKLTKHTLKRRREKTVDYREKSFYYFRLIILDPSPKLDIE